MTLSLGVRYDLRPGFEDREGNISNFLRDTANGDVVVPDEESLRLTSPGFAGSLGATRIVTASQAGLPVSLRNTDRNNVAPRLGVAWRPGGDTRTVIRAGYGIYYTRVLGAVFNSLTGIHTSDNETFPNAFDAATRTYGIVWPNTFAGDPSRGVTRVGTQNFSTASDPDSKDPRTQQWSLTFERELNRTNSVRFTYSGFRSDDLTMAPDLNQVAPNTVGFANLAQETRPYHNWFRVNTRDNGGYHNYHDVVAQLSGTCRGWASRTAAATSGRGRSTISKIAERARATSSMPAAMDAILGGWTVSSVIQAQSGAHFTAFYSSHCGSGTNCYGSEKADSVSGQDPNSGPKTLAQWFNTGTYTVGPFRDAAGRSVLGNAEKGAIIGPGV